MRFHLRSLIFCFDLIQFWISQNYYREVSQILNQTGVARLIVSPNADTLSDLAETLFHHFFKFTGDDMGYADALFDHFYDALEKIIEENII